MIRTIEWIDPDTIKMIDQTKLPKELIFLELRDYRKVAESIKIMNVRGAPAIGVTAAMGMACASIEYSNTTDYSEFWKNLEKAGELMKSTRPTAVNLFWAVDRMFNKAKEIEKAKGKNPKIICEGLIKESKLMAEEDIDINKRIGKHGAKLLEDGENILTHCNAGSLATVQYGTALAPIRSAIEDGKKISVIADETRPRLQGARLTAFELNYDNIPVKVQSDNCAGLQMMLGNIQKVIVGADRIANDAVINKIGTYMVALAAKRHNIPFYVAAPVSTLSLNESSSSVTIEQRDGSEVGNILGQVKIIPEGVETINYAFDITPFDLVAGVITEDGVFTPKQLVEKYS